MDDYILRMENITKHFPGVKALSDVTFRVKRGEIHALLGENGAGKSTLMKVLCGMYAHGNYGGDMYIDDKLQEYHAIKDSEKAGVAIIFQELGVARNMNVCENIFLGNEVLKPNKTIDWDFEMRKTRELLKELKLDVDPLTPVGALGTGQQQLVEIAKALSKDVRLLILDEPTSSLTEADTKNLFEILNGLRDRGVTSIFITHKLYEAIEMSDTITILRDGQTIATKATKDFPEDAIIASMVGREMTERFPRVDHQGGEVVLETKNWTVMDPERLGHAMLNNINIKVKKGEILGIAGLMGSGRTELAMSLFGALELKHTGEMTFNGKKHAFANPKQAYEAGLAYVSEDRKRFGLVLPFDIAHNMTLASLEKITRRGMLDKQLEAKKVDQSIQDFRVKTPSRLQEVRNLSGGNQQKVVLAKALLTEPKVLILDEPTRGIDVGSKYEIYQLMNRLVEQGVSIVMISSELPEVINMSDRIYVMHEGKITAEVECGGEHEVTQEQLLLYAVGGKQNVQ